MSAPAAYARAAGRPGAITAFLVLSLAAVALPLTEMGEAIGLSNVLFAFSVFAVIVAAELFVIHLAALALASTRIAGLATRTLITLALTLNVGAFFASLVNGRIPLILAALAALAVAFWLLVPHAAARRGLVAFGVLLMAMSLSRAIYSALADRMQGVADQQVAAKGARPVRNVYVLCFDALTSRAALAVFYGGAEHPVATRLEELGFRVMDAISPADDTLRTWGSMLSLGQPFNHLVSRTFFNGLRPVPLYQRLRQEGYRIQFVYATEFFGIDAKRLDYFYPDTSSPFICEFVDPRYGLFACREWFRTRLEKWTGLRVVARIENERRSDPREFDRIVARFDHAAASQDRWFSMAHLWFPGHSSLSLRHDDLTDIAAFRNAYLASLPTVAGYVARLVADIRARDKDPVIVIFGDHGTFVARDATPGTVFYGRPLTGNDILLDTRGALLAIYPRSFCVDPIARDDPAMLFADILDCLKAELPRS